MDSAAVIGLVIAAAVLLLVALLARRKKPVEPAAIVPMPLLRRKVSARSALHEVREQTGALNVAIRRARLFVDGVGVFGVVDDLSRRLVMAIEEAQRLMPKLDAATSQLHTGAVLDQEAEIDVRDLLTTTAQTTAKLLALVADAEAAQASAVLDEITGR